MNNPKAIFDNAWVRCSVLTNAYAFSSARMTGVFQSDEILRAEWVARVSALDLYIHEIVAQKMVDIFRQVRPTCRGYEKFTLPHRIVDTLRDRNITAQHAETTFNLEIRRQLSFQTFQNSTNIGDGIRLISDKEFWKEIALHQGATTKNSQTKAQAIKLQLDSIVDRRNKIAHEGDMQPIVPRSPWPITSADLVTVRDFISNLVDSIEAIV